MQGTAPEVPVLASCSAPHGKVSKPLLPASPCQPTEHGHGYNWSLRLLIKETRLTCSSHEPINTVIEKEFCRVGEGPIQIPLETEEWTCYMKHKEILQTDFEDTLSWICINLNLYRTAVGHSLEISDISPYITLNASTMRLFNKPTFKYMSFSTL